LKHPGTAKRYAGLCTLPPEQPFEDIIMSDQLIRNLDFLHMILEAVPSSLFVVDSDLRVVHLNSAAARMVGAEPEAVFMHRGGEVLHCIQAAKTPGGCGQAAVCRECVIRNSVLKAVQESSVHRESTKMEFVTPEGASEVSLQITTSPIAYEGSIYALLVIEDISELMRIQEALRDSEAKLRNMASVIGEGIYVLDRNNRLTFMNPEAEKLLGWTETELLGKQVHDIFHHQRADGTRLSSGECPVHKTITTGTTYRSDENTFMRKDGTFFPASIIATPLREHGQIAGSVTVFQDITERKHAAEQLQQLNELLARQATTDTLTGISNRLKFSDTLSAEIRRSRRYDLPLSLIMFDIDHFKRINDTYGHHTGDSVLKELAGLVQQNVRLHDLFARWGGEEFMIMVTSSPLEKARLFAEKLRFMMEEHSFSGAGRVTCSFGVVQFVCDETDDRFTRRVDDALYRAKAQGGNRVQTA